MNGYTRILPSSRLLVMRENPENGRDTSHMLTIAAPDTISYSTVEGSGVSIREARTRCKSEDE